MAFTNRDFNTVTSAGQKDGRLGRWHRKVASMLCGELTRYRPARRTKSGGGLHTGKANGYERDEKAYFEDCIGDWIDCGGRGMWTPEVRVYHRTGIGPSNSGTDGRCGSRQSGSVEEIFCGRCHVF